MKIAPIAKRKALLLGCGSEHSRRVNLPGDGPGWFNYELTTLDININHSPDVVHDLRIRPWPFPDDSFDRVDAYEVLEHLGRLGDAQSFFDDFSEIYRILKPGGFLAATCPSYRSMWAWGDPSHTRVLTSGTLAFLSQREYVLQVGTTAMSDFRDIYKADFEIVQDERDEAILLENDVVLVFALRAIKPSRWAPPIPRKRGLSCRFVRSSLEDRSLRPDRLRQRREVPEDVMSKQIRRFLLTAVSILSMIALWLWQVWHLIAHALGLPCPL